MALMRVMKEIRALVDSPPEGITVSPQSCTVARNRFPCSRGSTHALERHFDLPLAMLGRALLCLVFH
jgi:hypothetical protein